MLKHNLKKTIVLTEEILEKLIFLSDKNYTNHSQLIRSLIDKDYKNTKSQLESINQFRLQ